MKTIVLLAILSFGACQDAEENDAGLIAPTADDPQSTKISDNSYGPALPPVPNSQPIAYTGAYDAAPAPAVSQPVKVGKSMMPMPYGFQYAVRDDSKALNFGHKAASDGNLVTGSYYVLLPDGRMQTVNYQADEDGYVAQVAYDDDDDDSPPQFQTFGAYAQQQQTSQWSQVQQSSAYGVPVPLQVAPSPQIVNGPAVPVPAYPTSTPSPLSSQATSSANSAGPARISQAPATPVGPLTTPSPITTLKPIPQQPATQQPAIQQPAFQQPALQQPVPQQPASKQPTSQQPTLQQGTPQQPVPQQPAPQQPAPQQPVPQQPAPQQPAAQQPSPQQPAQQQSVPQQPAPQPPALQQPPKIAAPVNQTVSPVIQVTASAQTSTNPQNTQQGTIVTVQVPKPNVQVNLTAPNVSQYTQQAPGLAVQIPSPTTGQVNVSGSTQNTQPILAVQTSPPPSAQLNSQLLVAVSNSTSQQSDKRPPAATVSVSAPQITIQTATQASIPSANQAATIVPLAPASAVTVQGSASTARPPSASPTQAPVVAAPIAVTTPPSIQAQVPSQTVPPPALAPSATLGLLQLQLCASCPPRFPPDLPTQKPTLSNAPVQQTPSIPPAPTPGVQQPSWPQSAPPPGATYGGFPEVPEFEN